LPSSRKEESVGDTEKGGKGLGLTVNQWLPQFFVPPPLYNLIFMVSTQISFTETCFDKNTDYDTKNNYETISMF
jgi:hypothetical protein